MMKARERIIQIVTNSVAPLLSAAGFQKSGLAFYRRLNGVVQVVQIQFSTANIDDHGYFTITVALNFDLVCQLEGRPIIEQPKEFQCQFRRRLEHMIPEVPARWAVGIGTEQPGLVLRLQAVCAQLVAQLNRIDSIQAFLALGWQRGQAEAGLRAQIHYLLGDRQAAILDLQDPIFRSRPTWDFASWLEQRGLSELQDDVQAAGE